MQHPPLPSQPEPPPAGKAVLKAGSICLFIAVVSIIAQPVLLAFIHGPLMAVCIVLAIIAIAKDQVQRGVQLLLASIFMLPTIFALSLFVWFVGIGTVIASLGAESRSTTSSRVTPPAGSSATTRLASKQATVSLASLKIRFLDMIRTKNAVSMADFGATDQEIEIQIQPDSNFDSTKAKNAAITVAKGWQELSGQPKVSVSIWQGVNLLAKESFP
jgi:hypothetical protein